MITSVRILVGNEPFTYRHVQAEALRAYRPDANVVLIEPRDIDGAIARLSPHIVFCSVLSEVVQTQPLAWVLLHPDGANLAVVSIAGQQRVIQGVSFDDLLAVVDEISRRLMVPVEAEGKVESPLMS